MGETTQNQALCKAPTLRRLFGFGFDAEKSAPDRLDQPIR